MKLNYELTYKIRPLVWESYVLSDGVSKMLTTQTIWGSMRVEHEDGCVKWSYCFDEYYDEDDYRCESIEDGKQKAEAFYLSRLKDALIEL